jgi:hypothetical protein
MPAATSVGRWGWVPYVGLVLILVLAALVPQWFEPVIRDDPARNIEIPGNLLHPMRVKAAYNEETMFFRFELPTPEPSYYHDYWVYEGEGRWRREGRSQAGRQPHGIYEDRITFLLDDGRVPDFGRYGGFITASGRAMRFFTDAAAEEVRQHPYYGPRGESDVRKWLPDTRTDPHDWRTVKPEEELHALRDAGYFLDLWHWRAHRSNPIGWSDDQYILDYRWNDEGRGMYTTNWDEENRHPQYMFDRERTGQVAMRWEDVAARRIAQHDYLRYALILGNEEIQGNAAPFDTEHQWQIGDVIPRQLLRVPSGSRGAIRANGIYMEGRWLVDLWRQLDTGAPQYDKILHHKGLYQIAFAAHILSTGSRWHYVSFPLTLGLDRDADIVAVRFEGSSPPWDRIEWYDLKLFYPGQIDWSHLISRAHAGADDMAAGTPLRVGHDEETLARYAVHSEFRAEIRSQWRQTLIAMMGFIFLTSLGVFAATRFRERQTAL